MYKRPAGEGLIMVSAKGMKTTREIVEYNITCTEDGIK